MVVYSFYGVSLISFYMSLTTRIPHPFDVEKVGIIGPILQRIQLKFPFMLKIITLEVMETVSTIHELRPSRIKV